MRSRRSTARRLAEAVHHGLATADDSHDHPHGAGRGIQRRAGILDGVGRFDGRLKRRGHFNQQRKGTRERENRLPTVGFASVRSGVPVSHLEPARDCDFAVGVELERIAAVHFQIAEEAVAGPAERKVRHRRRDPDIDADH